MQTKITEFEGSQIYIGIDVHKRSWCVSILTEETEHRTFTQPPDPKILWNYVNRMFPGANYHSAYEAGFCGYKYHRQLNEMGITNIVVNPADVPTTGKEKAGKTDKVDSRKIAKGLRSGELRGIHVFERSHQEVRSMARHRHLLQKDLRRFKQRIKMQLLHYGITIPEQYDNENWSKGFEQWLSEVIFETQAGSRSFNYLLEGYQFHKQQVRCISNELRKLFRKRYKEDYNLLRTIPGIGPLSAIAIITELGDINRFGHINKLCSYAGLQPLIHNSGETEKTSGMTYRCNPYIRTILIEASWQAVRLDPAMLLYYRKHASRGNGKRAIVKVARKLLSRIRFVLKNKKRYEVGIK